MPTCHALLQGCVVVSAVAAGRDLGADLQRCLFGAAHQEHIKAGWS